MRPLTAETLRDLLKGDQPPCISLYQPTHPAIPGALEDPIRYKNLVREAERSLREKYAGRDVEPLIRPFAALINDTHFWQYSRQGLAILASPTRFDVFRLPRPVKEFVEVADSFHVKPLLRIVQSADRYQVLCLDRHKVRMLEGNRDALHELDTGDMPTTMTEVLGEQVTEAHQNVGAYGKRAGPGAPAHGGTGAFPGLGGRKDEEYKDTERFFQFIDREVLQRFSRPSGLPLILAALPENQSVFRRISRNPLLQPEGVMRDPDPLTLDQLRAEVWRILEPRYLARLARLTDEHRAAAANGLGSTDVNVVAQATAAGRVKVLLVDADRVVPGRFDPQTGEVHPGRLADPEVGDVLDDLAEAVLRTGGEVIIVPSARMPAPTGVAATFRH